MPFLLSIMFICFFHFGQFLYQILLALFSSLLGNAVFTCFLVAYILFTMFPIFILYILFLFSVVMEIVHHVNKHVTDCFHAETTSVQHNAIQVINRTLSFIHFSYCCS